MAFKLFFVVLMVMVVVCGVGCAGTPIPPAHYPPDVQALMDFTADPCNDFWEYSCGGWLLNTTLPPSQPIIERAITSIEDYNAEILNQLMTSPTTPTKYPLIVQFYNDCMDTSTINNLGLEPLASYYSALDVETLEDFMSGVGFLHSIGIPALFTLSVVQDAENPNMNIAEFDQGGFNLPAQEMYTDPQSQQLIVQYQQHITTMFSFLGDPDPSGRAKDVIFVETQIASANLPLDEIRDPYSVYHKIDMDGLRTLTPLIPWDPYLEAINRNNLSNANVAEPAFFQALNNILTNVSTSELDSYLKWFLLHNVANLMPDTFVNETFNFFGQILEGETQIPDRATTCIQATDTYLGNILGQAYVDLAFPGQSKSIAVQMIQSIEQAFLQELKILDWMDNTTRAAAELKLSQVTQRVGYPENPSYYPGYDVITGQYLESTLTKANYDFANTISGLDQPPNLNLWGMTADTVNAYYQPTDNSINFPAGILQNPYFLASRNPAMNYGGLGVIMGHELTHGFDDQGKDYDGHGKLDNWWQNSTAQQFALRAQCMVNQYSQFQILPGVFVNGNLTLGENIADNGGVLNSYHAYTNLMSQSGQTPDYALLFVSYAQGWCAKASPEFEKARVQTDVHSPPKFRVLGPLMNLDFFSQTFSCPVGSVMNPTTKCKIW